MKGFLVPYLFVCFFYSFACSYGQVIVYAQHLPYDIDYFSLSIKCEFEKGNKHNEKMEYQARKKTLWVNVLTFVSI